MHHEGDFLIIKNGRKNALVKIVSVPNEGELVVRREESKVEGRRITETVSTESIILNLGPTPIPGTVYGCKIEPYYSASTIDGWGDIHYYRELERDEKKTIKRAAAKAWKSLKKLRLTAFAPLTIEVRLAKGSEIGYYKMHKAQETDVLCLKPKEFHHDELVRLFYHEAGHGILDRMMPVEFRARWIKAYTHYTTLSKLDPDEIRGIRALVEGTGSLTGVDGVDSEKLDLCVDSIHSNYGLKKRDIEELLEQGYTLEDYWPTHPLDLADNEVPLTDYANKNWNEFFCEALAMHLTGIQLPKRIRNLLLKTIEATKE